MRDLAQRRGIALAVLPGDGREDIQLDAFSTLPVSTLRRLSALCDAGGALAAQAALAQLALAAGLYAGPVQGEKNVPDYGWYDLARGVVAEPIPTDRPLVVVTFYRSYLTAADTEPVDALIDAFRSRGFDAIGLFVPSLKAPGATEWTRDALRKVAPAAVVNATAFSARGDDGTSPLDVSGCPVFQVALSTARKRDWAASDRGLSSADLAMHVVLPELDGRIFAGVTSFKSPGKRDPDLQYSRFAHRADSARIEAVADRVTRLASAWRRHRRRRESWRWCSRPIPDVRTRWRTRSGSMRWHRPKRSCPIWPRTVTRSPTARRSRRNCRRERWPGRCANIAPPSPAFRSRCKPRSTAAWGEPEADPAVKDGAFHFAALDRGHALIALQPERGEVSSRDADYHDLARTPRHGYVAFYLWLRAQQIHALVHIGAHGTLEWLPGKSVALSESCWPEALTAGLPVIYPFIVNDPGESAQAKRRIGAVTLGHLPPPQIASAMPAGLLRLEQLLDEYSTADGLDPARRVRLVATIRAEAQSAGVEQDLGLTATSTAAEAITRIDRFVCDIKASQFGDGLHIYGQGAGEREGLLTALAGRRVAAGPSGSPARGRSDVLPTGRNMFSVDPRAVPSRSAHAQGVKLAEELLRRHLQDHGDWPRSLVIDLWGSATMRTAGEEFAMALHLAGLAPRWDANSERINGIEVVPLALLGRPRIDVTLAGLRPVPRRVSKSAATVRSRRRCAGRRWRARRQQSLCDAGAARVRAAPGTIRSGDGRSP